MLGAEGQTLHCADLLVLVWGAGAVLRSVPYPCEAESVLTCACAPAACPYGQPTTETVSRPFVAQPVPAGDCLWVNVEIVPDAIVYATAAATNQPVAIGITAQTLTFDGGAGAVTVTIPTGVVTFSPDNATVPTTSFDGNAWQTAVAASSTGQARR